MCYVTCDMWHMTRDTWHMTRDMFGGGDILSKFQLLLFVIYDIMKIWRKRMNESVNELMMRLFIEQPGLHRVCY